MDFKWSFETYWQPRIDEALAKRTTEPVARPAVEIAKEAPDLRDEQALAEQYDEAAAKGELDNVEGDATTFIPSPPSPDVTQS